MAAAAVRTPGKVFVLQPWRSLYNDAFYFDNDTLDPAPALAGTTDLSMNSKLEFLHPYPFQRLKELLQGHAPNNSQVPIDLSIGEPKHATPAFIRDALVAGLDGLSKYPSTLGSDALRQAIAGWIHRRYGIPAPDAATQVLPVNGTREALFAFAQAVVDTGRSSSPPVVLMPNPFYQIYEGAALLAGAEPYYVNMLPETEYAMDFSQVPESVWKRTQLVYACSPGNPTGRVMTLADWQQLFALSDRYGFVIAADECYSEIYFDEAAPPLGALQAAWQLGRTDFANLVIFESLSKRSNVPGMRSGFVAGDARILKSFLLYRTYHGSAMSPAVMQASIAAWQDEAHVIANREQYRQKFAAVTPILADALPLQLPQAGFYYWVATPGSDTEFTQALYRTQHVTVLPGSFLARPAHGVNPGRNFVRIALVAPLEQCVEAAGRIRTCIEQMPQVA